MLTPSEMIAKAFVNSRGTFTILAESEMKFKIPDCPVG